MASHYQGSVEEVRALDAYIKLVRAAESLTTRLHRGIPLTLSQFAVLEALWHLGPLCQRDLAQKLLKSEGNLTLVLDNLVKQGFVQRERSQQDRRFVTISLTDQGQQQIQTLFPAHVQALLQEMAVLTPTEQEELGRLCRKLGKQ
jgi:MarR family 2-MHQ and catechol resistance regulon transcriptional repressor